MYLKQKIWIDNCYKYKKVMIKIVDYLLEDKRIFKK